MQRKLALICSLIFASLLTAPAQSTVNFTAAPAERDIMYNGMTHVPDGNKVSVGFFDSGFDILGSAQSLAALSSAWNEYGSTVIQTVFGEPGRFAGTESSSSPAFDNETVWLWVFATTDNDVPAPDFSNVSSYGLYSSSLANWEFPVQGAVPPGNTTSVNSSEVNQVAFGSLDGDHLFLSPVPEPGMMALLGLGSVLLTGFTIFRRRSSRVSSR